MSLFQEIQKRLRTQQPAAPTGTDAAAQQAQIQRVIEAKSGKAGPAGPAPRASSVAGEAAAAGAGAALAQQGAANELAAQQVGQQATALATEQALGRERLAAQGRTAQLDLNTRGQLAAGQRAADAAQFGARLTAEEEAKARQMNFAADQAIKQLASQRKITEGEIFATFKQGQQELAFRRDAAELEQLAFLKAMQDKEYVRQLQEIGQLRRLENEANFRKEIAQTVFDSQIQDLIAQLGWKSAYDADQREWNEQVNRIDPETALAIATSQAQSEAAKNYVQGAGELAGAGIKAYEYKTAADTQKRNDIESQPGFVGPQSSNKMPE